MLSTRLSPEAGERVLTEMASASCFARGVDHFLSWLLCLEAVTDKLRELGVALSDGTPKARGRLRSPPGRTRGMIDLILDFVLIPSDLQHLNNS